MSDLLYVDTSALVRRYVAAPDRFLVIDAMDAAEHWVASGLARTEVLTILHRLAGGSGRLGELWTRARGDWDRFWEIPVDRRALDDAVDLGGRFGLSTLDAIQVACANRLPRPAAFCTFERQQIPAAIELGFDVIAPTSGPARLT